MSDEELLLSDRPPSRTQVRTVGTVALLFLSAFLISLPFRFQPLPRVGAFIVIVDTALLLGDLLTATLLFSQATVLRSRGLMALATGYLFAGLIIIPHVLTFPFAFAERGLLSAGISTTIWLYLFWHVGLPTAVIVYAALKKMDATEPMPHNRVRTTIVLCVAGAAALAALLGTLATVGGSLLPRLMTGPVTWLPLRVLAIAWIPIGLSAVALGAVLRGKRSVLDIWLALVLWAWLLELLLVLITTNRFGLGWYVGRISGLLSGVLVLLMLIAESNRLYARLVTSVTTQRREREGRLLTMNAIAAAMAHEVKQPLGSMVAGAGACIETLHSTPSNLKRVLELLELIEADGHRAAEAIDGIRTMFVRRPSDSTHTDLNELIRETSSLVAGELAAWRVTLQLRLDEQAPLLAVDRLQMKHVLLNLFVNAIEAMSAVTDRPRTLIVRSISNSAIVEVTVEDSGTGIEAGYAERIFDTFFTTKRQGTGIGLSLSRSVIEAHNGRIWATSEKPFGATFHVELPQCRPSMPQAVRVSSIGGRSGSRA
jgi:signal transduction histidine kinase